MTAEITIMNKEAVALAADSAVTMSGGETGEKIFASANKLFALSKYQPVGIMVYGSADLMGVPWETIVKIYRKDRLGKKAFGTLEEYARDFLGFLDNGNTLFPESIQESYAAGAVYEYFRFVKERVEEKVHSQIDNQGKITYEEIGRIAREVIAEQYEEWGKTKNVPSIPKSYDKRILEKYGNIIDKAIEETFEELPLSARDLTRLKKIAASLFSKFPESVVREGASGVVIAGFGKEDTFPSVKSFDIEGVVNNRLKYKEYVSGKIGLEDSGASIMPFAQIDMVTTFMEGVDLSYRDTEQSYLSQMFSDYADMAVGKMQKYADEEKKEIRTELGVLGEKILQEHNKRLDEYRQEKYVGPILDVVSMLPKDELAAMAESLVNLTSFKRRVTMERETVAGPIDVAVISKGDGFVWIKRKHYFKPELNPQFFANYYREE